MLGTRSLQQPRAGDEGRWKTTIAAVSRRDVHRVPGDAVLEGTVISARQWRALIRQRRAVWLVVGLAAAAYALRNTRLDRQLIVGAIVLRALAEMGRKDLSGAVSWLIAWQNARVAEWEKTHRRRMAKARQRGSAATDTPAETLAAGSD
jgi:hypothetical protein